MNEETKAVAGFIILTRIRDRIPLRDRDAREQLYQLKSTIADKAVRPNQDRPYRLLSPASAFFAAAVWAKSGNELADQLFKDDSVEGV